MTPLSAFRLTWTRVAKGRYRHSSGATVERIHHPSRAFRWTIVGGPRAGCLFGSLTSAAAVAAPTRDPWPRDVRRERVIHEPAPAGMLF